MTPAQRRLSGDVLIDLGGGAMLPVSGAALGGVAGMRDGGAPPKNGFDEKPVVSS